MRVLWGAFICKSLMKVSIWESPCESLHMRIFLFETSNLYESQDFHRENSSKFFEVIFKVCRSSTAVDVIMLSDWIFPIEAFRLKLSVCRFNQKGLMGFTKPGLAKKSFSKCCRQLFIDLTDLTRVQWRASSWNFQSLEELFVILFYWKSFGF